MNHAPDQPAQDAADALLRIDQPLYSSTLSHLTSYDFGQCLSRFLGKDHSDALETVDKVCLAITSASLDMARCQRTEHQQNLAVVLAVLVGFWKAVPERMVSAGLGAIRLVFQTEAAMAMYVQYLAVNSLRPYYDWLDRALHAVESRTVRGQTLKRLVQEMLQPLLPNQEVKGLLEFLRKRLNRWVRDERGTGISKDAFRIEDIDEIKAEIFLNERTAEALRWNADGKMEVMPGRLADVLRRTELLPGRSVSLDEPGADGEGAEHEDPRSLDPSREAEIAEQTRIELEALQAVRLICAQRAALPGGSKDRAAVRSNLLALLNGMTLATLAAATGCDRGNLSRAYALEKEELLKDPSIERCAHLLSAEESV